MGHRADWESFDGFFVSGLVGGLLLPACDSSGCSLVGAGTEVSFFLSEVLASVHRG